MHIKDQVLQSIFGGGYLDWDFLENIVETKKIDIDEEDIIDINDNKGNFNYLLDFAFREIQREWEEFISEQEGEEIELELEMFTNFLDSHIDNEGVYDWEDTPAQAYEKYLEKKENNT